jgi:hypothetical protein
MTIFDSDSIVGINVFIAYYILNNVAMMTMRPCSLMGCCQVAMKNLRLSVKALGIGPKHCDLRILELITFSYIPCQALPHVKVYEKNATQVLP